MNQYIDWLIRGKNIIFEHVTLSKLHVSKFLETNYFNSIFKKIKK